MDPPFFVAASLHFPGGEFNSASEQDAAESVLKSIAKRLKIGEGLALLAAVLSIFLVATIFYSPSSRSIYELQMTADGQQAVATVCRAITGPFRGEVNNDALGGTGPLLVKVTGQTCVEKPGPPVELWIDRTNIVVLRRVDEP